MTQKQRETVAAELSRVRQDIERDSEGAIATIRHTDEHGYVTEVRPVYDDSGRVVAVETANLGIEPLSPEDRKALLRAQLVQEKFRKGTSDSRVTYVSRDSDGMWRTPARRGA